jgi:hypothetical protein
VILVKRILSVSIILFLLFAFLKVHTVKGVGGILVKVGTDKVSYKLGETVNITFTVSNESSAPQKLIFNTAQIYDFTVSNVANSSLFYRWSQGRMFAQVVTEINLAPNEVKTFKEQWNQKSNNGIPASEGTYRLNFWLVTNDNVGKAENQENINKAGQLKYFATAIFLIGNESQTVSPFSDVKDLELIKYLFILYSRGIINGYPDGTFKPEHNLTRAEAVTLILRSMGITPRRYLNPTFNDVSRTYWAFNLIEEAYQRGIVKGISLYTFSPNAHITRGEFTVMVMRALGFELLETQNTFVDIDETYFGYKEIINAYGLGIVQGININGKLYFYPNSAVTRAEAVLILGRAIEKKG